MALCCTDQQLGEVSPPHRHLFDANVFRPPKLQHTVERRDANGHLGRLPPFGPRAQRVTNHSLVAADIGLHQGTPIVTRCPLPAVLDDYTEPGPSGTLRVLWPSSRHLAPKLRVFVDFLAANLFPLRRPKQTEQETASRGASVRHASPSSAPRDKAL